MRSYSKPVLVDEDKEHKLIYVALNLDHYEQRMRKEPGTVKETRRFLSQRYPQGVNVDLDAEGKVVGIELEGFEMAEEELAKALRGDV
jgi:uncharacterized protein YuzE